MTKYSCECGSMVSNTKSSIARHNKTKKHQNFLGQPVETYSCECGSTIRNTKSSIKKHNKTKKHLNYLSTVKPEIVEPEIVEDTNYNTNDDNEYLTLDLETIEYIVESYVDSMDIDDSINNMKKLNHYLKKNYTNWKIEISNSIWFDMTVDNFKWCFTNEDIRFMKKKLKTENDDLEDIVYDYICYVVLVDKFREMILNTQKEQKFTCIGILNRKIEPLRYAEPALIKHIMKYLK